MKIRFICSLIAALVLAGFEARPEGLTIVEAPPRLPSGLTLGCYSPPLSFQYSGLQAGQIYTLKVWLLTPGPWFCASSQWCERNLSLDNTNGTNSEGTLLLAESMDVY